MFGFSFDRRTISIIIGVMLGFTVLKYISNPESLVYLLYSAPAVLIAVTFHEFAHGWAAYMLGDTTAKDEGRLSLNPFSHLDPIGTIMLLLAGFGWGKPVRVDPRNYTKKISMEKGEAIVSAAGPLMNLLLALVFTLIYYALYKFAPATFLMSTVGYVIMQLISYIVLINIGLGVFNLIPLPPLDGEKILKPILPYSIKNWFEKNEHIFYIIFIIIFITGIAGEIISPVIQWIFSGFNVLGKFIFRI